MKPRDRVKFKGRKETGTFLLVPTEVLDSPNFRGLSHKAKGLLLDLGAQFRGHNNGDLSAPWSLMHRRGWRSKDTLDKALRELRAAGMIERTRQGGLHACSLYAFTWLPIDACGDKLDVCETHIPSGLWKPEPMPNSTNENARPTPPIGAHHPGYRDTRRANGKETGLCAPPAVPKAA